MSDDRIPAHASEKMPEIPADNVSWLFSYLAGLCSVLDVCRARALREIRPVANPLPEIRRIVHEIAKRAGDGEDERRLSESFANLPDDLFEQSGQRVEEALRPIRVEAGRLWKIWEERWSNLPWRRTRA